jgi:hypothetical protein
MSPLSVALGSSTSSTDTRHAAIAVPSVSSSSTVTAGVIVCDAASTVGRRLLQGDRRSLHQAERHADGPEVAIAPGG